MIRVISLASELEDTLKDALEDGHIETHRVYIELDQNVQWWAAHFH